MPTNTEAKTAEEIEASVNEALEIFFKNVDSAKEIVNQAKALLVLPDVAKTGLNARVGTVKAL